MKRIYLCTGVLMVLLSLLLAGCDIHKIMKLPQTKLTSLQENQKQLIGKKEDIPLIYQSGIFRLWNLTIGQNEDEMKKELGIPEKETEVKDFWRYDKIDSYKKDRMQIDIALFRSQLDEITVTIPSNKPSNWEGFKELFNGDIYRATKSTLEKEKEVKEMYYYVTPNEDQMLIVKLKGNGDVILTYTYAYDLLPLKEKNGISIVQEKKEE